MLGLIISQDSLLNVETLVRKAVAFPHDPGFSLLYKPTFYFVCDFSIAFASEVTQQKTHPESQLQSRKTTQQVTLGADPVTVSEEIEM